MQYSSRFFLKKISFFSTFLIKVVEENMTQQNSDCLQPGEVIIL